ncbi:MAG: thioredoxin family protein [Solirubrobacteraceae bacterium]|jgi:peroxiredoxin|nr:thioredoxin family protein [Solirubrobacteraceae bacterium]
MTLALGDPLPAFDLPATDGTRHAVPGEAAATVVVFTCNHCPYALAWHERIVAVARDYAERGVRVLQVNSNDAERYPRDSLEAMAERVARDPQAWPTPYLHDATQEVARAYGAQTTPDVFVAGADGRLAYRGAPDADWEDEALGATWLRGALDALLAGRACEPAETKPVGCSIKWRT